MACVIFETSTYTYPGGGDSADEVALFSIRVSMMIIVFVFVFVSVSVSVSVML